MAKKRYKEKTKLSDAVKIIVIGLLLGTVFTFGARISNASVTQDECTVVETEFVDYNYRYRRGGERLSVDCADGERYWFDAASDLIKLRDDMAEIPPQEKITMLLHPNSHSIMEFTTKNEVILSFDEAMEDMARDRKFFFCMGIVMYGGAVYGGVAAMQCLRRRNERNKHR